jgi:hypothetical protein
MSNHNIDFGKLRNESDVKIAKEKLKNFILVQEKILSTSMDNLGGNIMDSVKRSLLDMAARIVTNTLLNQLKRK